ncbi:MAG: sensor histidine kinase [Geminicoccaceae bacterium]
MSPVAVGTSVEHRVLILPPSTVDGNVAVQVLTDVGIMAALCADEVQLRAEANAGAAVLMMTEEAVAGPSFQGMARFLDRQPAWSDIPLIILTTRSREPTTHWRMIAEQPSVRNATLLERPMRIDLLVQAVRVALRTRERQYQLRAHMAERETLLTQQGILLREVHHRVKNNLQMMQSLVRLSASRAPPTVEPLFDDLAARLGAMGQLHTRIYASGNLTAIDAAAYLGDVIDHIDMAFGQSHGRVRTTRRLQPVVIDVDTAIPLGLITTELLTNAHRYAFPAGASGAIRVELEPRGDAFELTVTDDGVGLPDSGAHAGSTGLRLVRALAKQIGGTFAMRSDQGASASLTFRPKQHEPA